MNLCIILLYGFLDLVQFLVYLFDDGILFAKLLLTRLLLELSQLVEFLHLSLEFLLF